MIHPGEKPFNCSKFKTISSLKRHEMAHTREPPQGQIVLPELLNMIILLTCSDIFQKVFGKQKQYRHIQKDIPQVTLVPFFGQYVYSVLESSLL